jgi:hypothetical protein
MASTRDRKATTHRGLCFCGIRVDGKRGRYACGINANQRPADKERIVPLFDGRRVYPLGERHSEHHEPPRTQPISGYGRSRNTARVFLSTPGASRRGVPRKKRAPVSRDLPRSDPEPVIWWAPS